MSMRDYAVDDYGLLLTEEVMKIIASKFRQNMEDADDYDDGDILYEDGMTFDAGIMGYWRDNHITLYIQGVN